MKNVTSIFLNGEFLQAREAAISPFDRGFLFGDGVYEVIPVYGGRIFRLAGHLQRLEASLASIRLANPFDRSRWAAMLDRLADSAGEGTLYLQVTRGVAPRDHRFPDVEPTVFAYMQAADPEPGMQTASAITLPDWRWTRCDIKAVSLLANVLARDEAARQGGNEAIFVRDGLVTEGAASNIFLVDGGQVITSRQDQRILAGITRELLLELLRGEGIAVSERDIRAGELATAEEVWMTSSTKGVIPVVGIDGRPVAGGEPGPLFARAAGFYAEFVARFRAGEVE